MRARPHMLAAIAAALGGAELMAPRIQGAPPPRRKGSSARAGYVMGYAHTDGTYNRGHNKGKRRERAAIARLKGAPGGWKKALRQLQAMGRAKNARQVPPHRSGGGQ